MLVCVFGKRGAGKTTTIAHALQHCQGPVVVADILGNYKNKKNEKGEIIGPKMTECDSLSEGINAINSWLANPKEETKIIVIKAPDPDVTVDFLSSVLWEAGRGTLVLDEADGFSLDAAPCYDWLVRYGRNRNVDLLTGCRRPAEISRNITAGANRLYLFRTQEPRDIEYFRSIIGDRAFELMDVPQYSGLYVDYDSQQIGRFKIDESGQVFILSSESSV